MTKDKVIKAVDLSNKIDEYVCILAKLDDDVKIYVKPEKTVSVCLTDNKECRDNLVSIMKNFVESKLSDYKKQLEEL